jgi:hypothetical protein
MRRREERRHWKATALGGVLTLSLLVGVGSLPVLAVDNSPGEAFLIAIAELSDDVFEKYPELMATAADSETSGEVLPDLLSDLREAVAVHTGVEPDPELRLIFLNYLPEGEGDWYAVARLPETEGDYNRVLSGQSFGYVGTQFALIARPTVVLAPTSTPAIQRGATVFVHLIPFGDPDDLSAMAQIVAALDEAEDETLADEASTDLRAFLSRKGISREMISEFVFTLIDFEKVELGVDVSVAYPPAGWISGSEAVGFPGLSTDGKEVIVELLISRGF